MVDPALHIHDIAGVAQGQGVQCHRTGIDGLEAGHIAQGDQIDAAATTDGQDVAARIAIDSIQPAGDRGGSNDHRVVAILAVDDLTSRAQDDGVGLVAGIDRLHRVAGGDGVGAGRTGDGQAHGIVGGEGGGRSQGD